MSIQNVVRPIGLGWRRSRVVTFTAIRLRAMLPLSCARVCACTTFRLVHTAFSHWRTILIGCEWYCSRGRSIRSRRNKIRGNIDCEVLDSNPGQGRNLKMKISASSAPQRWWRRVTHAGWGQLRRHYIKPEYLSYPIGLVQIYTKLRTIHGVHTAKCKRHLVKMKKCRTFTQWMSNCYCNLQTSHASLYTQAQSTSLCMSAVDMHQQFMYPLTVV